MKITTPKIELARAFAIKAHGNQKYGDEFPYAIHLQAVESVLIRFGFMENEHLRCCAWLHDVLEDTETTYQTLRNTFGDDIAYTVSLLTEPKGGNRRWRHELTYPKIAESERALIVKLSDRIANIEAGGGRVNVYVEEHGDFCLLLRDKRDYLNKQAIDDMWTYIGQLLLE